MCVCLYCVYLSCWCICTSRSFFVRPVLTSDMEAIIALVSGVEGGDNVVTDVKNYLLARRDPQSEVSPI